MSPAVDTSLFDRVSDGIFVLGSDWTYTFINAAGADMVKRRPDELLGKVVWHAFPEAVGSVFEHNYRWSLEHQEPVEFEDYFAALERWYTIRVFPAPDGLTVVFQDSSARHAADRALEAILEQSRRQQRLVAVLAETNEAVFRSPDPEALFAAAVRIAVEQGGFVMAWIGVLDPASGRLLPVASAGDEAHDYLAGIEVTVHQGPAGVGVGGVALRTGSVVCSNDILTDENMAPWRDAAIRVGYRSSGAFPLVVAGEVRGLMSAYAAEPGYFDAEETSLVTRLAANVSYGWESLLRERALRDAEVARRSGERFRSALESAPAAILGLGPGGRIELVNRAAERLFGRSARKLAGVSGAELLRPASVEGRPLELERALRGTGGVAGESFQVLGRRLDGSEFPAEIAFSRVDASGEPRFILVSVLDLTERLELEEERRQRALEAERERADRLDSLGKLAGGIAHDFNNLLGVILNDVALLERRLEDERARADAAEIRAAAQRGAALTRQLLTFARRDQVDPIPLDLHRCVRSVASLLQRTLGPDIELRLRLGTRPLVAVIDPHQLDQVVLNLAINARDAMPDGGSLTISTRADGASGSATICVRDTGIGMTPEVVAHAFEPFFTTKARGQGTGLGLATVYGIVERNGGNVRIDSSPGRGTTVSVELPRSDLAPDRNEAGDAPPPALARSGARVLLVEDDDHLRDTTRRILADAGFDTVVARDGVEALEVIEDDGEDIGVVLSDVAMPRLRGDELARRLFERNPAIKVLLMTGYDSDGVGRQAAVLRKPVSAEVLKKAIREALDA